MDSSSLRVEKLIYDRPNQITMELMMDKIMYGIMLKRIYIIRVTRALQCKHF